MVISGF